jgi:hypothetical protein
MLFKLPFHTERPLALGLVLFAVALLFAFTWQAYVRKWWKIDELLGWYFSHKYRQAGRERAQLGGKYVLVLLTTLFGCAALLPLSIAIGLIENGERRPEPPKSEEEIVLEKFFEESKKIDIKKLLEEKD